MSLERNGGVFFILSSIFFLIVLLNPLSASGTDVSEAIYEDVTWAKADSPFVVTADIVVEESATLTIEPGVTVTFNEGKKLEVAGTLVAQGTVDEQIYFTSSQDDPAAGDWKGIFFIDSSVDAQFEDNNYQSGSIIEYCVVEFAEKGISVDSASPYIFRNFIRKNILGLQFTSNAASIVEDNEIYSNSGTGEAHTGGMNILAASPIIKLNTFKNNSGKKAGAITYFGGGALMIDDCLFKDNQSTGGGAITCLDGSLKISGSNFINNTGYAIYNKSQEDSIATGCYWGTQEDSAIAEMIYDGNDDLQYGTVDFSESLAAENTEAGSNLGFKGTLQIKVQNIFTSDPIQGATLTSTAFQTSETTDVNGDFTISITPGTVSLIISADGYSTSDPVSVVIESGETNSIVINLVPLNVQISGIIRDGLTKVELSDASVDLDNFETVVTGADGTFAFESVSPEDNQTLIVSHADYVQVMTTLNAVSDQTMTYDIYLTPVSKIYNTLNLSSGWNLVSLNNFKDMKISSVFGDDLTKINSMWTWSDSSWKVYLPQEDDNGDAYAESKGFDILDDIPKNSGIWINANESFTLQIE
jgi:predicted outer membrane repeat protein